MQFSRLCGMRSDWQSGLHSAVSEPLWDHGSLWLYLNAPRLQNVGGTFQHDWQRWTTAREPQLGRLVMSSSVETGWIVCSAYLRIVLTEWMMLHKFVARGANQETHFLESSRSIAYMMCKEGAATIWNWFSFHSGVTVAFLVRHVTEFTVCATGKV